ncbi:MAG: hypothetical protein COB69_01580 [Phycisphaera sp.]|nr:MAG: hypothetical protein COB69_01580 [Phycisphaera sp.]
MDTTRFAALTAAALMTGAASAQDLTVVNAPWAGESTHSQMLSEAFGGTFSSLGQVTGINAKSGVSNLVDTGFTNGSYTFTRISDFGGSSFTTLVDIAGGDDSTWGAGSYRAEVIGGYSSNEHTFGYMTQGGEFQTVLEAGTGALEMASIHPNEQFSWAIQVGQDRQYNADNLLNEGGQDHMVSYAMFDESNRLIGAILFFEDWGGSGSDYDYNDFAVMLTLAPTPQAAMLGLLGLGGVGLLGGRRRRSIA